MNPVKRRGNMRRIGRRRRTPRISRAACRVANNIARGPSGKQTLTVVAPFELTINASGAAAFQINPGAVIAGSVYASISSIWTKYRVKNYNIRAYCSTSSTQTAGEYYGWLCRDTTGQTSLPFAVICGQPGYVVKKLWNQMYFNWRPIEPKDYDFDARDAITDDGILYLAVNPINAVNKLQIIVTMRIEVYSATFNSLQVQNRVIVTPNIEPKSGVVEKQPLPSEWQFC